MWSLCSTVVSGGRMMSAAVAGAAVVCSGICSTSTFLPLPFAGSGAGRWPWDRNVRRARVSVSTLSADLAGHLVKVGPVLALNGSTGQARRAPYGIGEPEDGLLPRMQRTDRGHDHDDRRGDSGGDRVAWPSHERDGQRAGTDEKRQCPWVEWQEDQVDEAEYEA